MSARSSVLSFRTIRSTQGRSSSIWQRLNTGEISLSVWTAGPSLPTNFQMDKTCMTSLLISNRCHNSRLSTSPMSRTVNSMANKCCSKSRSKTHLGLLKLLLIKSRISSRLTLRPLPARMWLSRVTHDMTVLTPERVTQP